MTDGTLKLVWIVPVMIFAIIAIVGGIFKDLFVWIKNR